MKGGGGGGAASKRRWRGLAIAALGLIIILSMLVPLGFLLGLHNGILSVSTGYLTEQHNSVSNDLRDFNNYEIGSPVIRPVTKAVQKDKKSPVEDLIKKFEPGIPKSVPGDLHTKDKQQIITNGTPDGKQQRKGTLWSPSSNYNATTVHPTPKLEANSKGSVDESGKSCELQFGSYCIWRQQHKKEVRDSLVKKMKDRLFEARAYFPSIAKLPSKENLTHEMKQNIQDFERVLSESSTDAELPSKIPEKLQKMESAITKAKSCPVECSNVDKKFRQLLDLTEDEANFHMKQSAFLYQVAVQTIPKSLHCLSMRLTVDYFRSPPHLEFDAEKFSDPSLHHFVVFSNNVLAASVVINSTIGHAKETRNLVFHILTDEENYFTMVLWFVRNAYQEVAIRVINVEKLDQHLQGLDNPALLLLPVEFRASIPINDSKSTLNAKTEYLSTFSHSHYLLPQIFSKFKKIIVLDEDVVIQKDLTTLWSLDLEGKVNGAAQTCSLRLGQVRSFLGDDDNLNKNSCSWMTGLNLIDLSRWRELDLTKTYKRFLKQDMNAETREFAVVRASILTFQDQIHPLDGSWMLSGLGHNYGLETSDLKKSAVLHYNGNMKPWLELGIPKYKDYWKRFVNWDDQIFSDCNISP